VSSTRLSPAELRRIAKKFDDERQEIETQLGIIQHWVDLTRSAWTGKAGLGYQNANQLWGAEQRSLLRLLGEVAEIARVHAGESEAATDQASQPFMTLPL
jgi:WXG100 family type VII secretion target